MNSPTKEGQLLTQIGYLKRRIPQIIIDRARLSTQPSPIEQSDTARIHSCSEEILPIAREPPRFRHRLIEAPMRAGLS